jgi:hypothetical protein
MDEIFVVIKEKQPIISLEELSGGDCIPWIKQKGLERLTRFLVFNEQFFKHYRRRSVFPRGM